MSKEVHRFNVVKMLSEEGNKIDYKPHGPAVVLASDYDALLAERDRLREDRDSQQRVCIAEMEKVNQLRSEVEALNELLRGVYPQLCARRDEQDLDDAQQYVLAEECQELIDGIDAALQGEQL